MKIKWTRVRKRRRKSARGDETMVRLSGLSTNVLFDFTDERASILISGRREMPATSTLNSYDCVSTAKQLSG